METTDTSLRFEIFIVFGTLNCSGRSKTELIKRILQITPSSIMKTWNNTKLNILNVLIVSTKFSWDG